MSPNQMSPDSMSPEPMSPNEQNGQHYQDPKEREIRRQFLDEAQAYLNTLEGAVLGLAGSRVDLQKINEAMRAAHSIKGGAAMMGYQTLSEFAHRLEDSFKVLKTKRQSLAISSDLENQLLTGVDCLQRVIQVTRQGQPLDPQWLEGVANPLFDQLRLELGDPDEENAASVLGGDDGGQELLSIIFSSEVEAVLQQLEGLLQNPAEADLRSELMTLAGELGGLGEMLQLPSFTSLCESVLEAIDQAQQDQAQQDQAQPDPAQQDLGAIAQASLSAWRRAQALVLTQQLDLIPTSLDVTAAGDFVAPTAEPLAAGFEAPAAAETWNLEPTWDNENFMGDGVPSETAPAGEGSDESRDDLANLGAAEQSPEVAAAIAEFEAAAREAAALENQAAEAFGAEAFHSDTFPSETVPPSPSAIPDSATDAWAEAALAELSSGADATYPTAENLTAENLTAGNLTPENSELEGSQFEDSEFENRVIPSSQVLQNAWQQTNAAAPVEASEDEDQTVRVSLKRVEQLNDLFGELTIERNALALYCDRLRSLTQLLKQRVKTLDQTNRELRTSYDELASGGRERILSRTGEWDLHSNRQPHSNGNGNTNGNGNASRNGHRNVFAVGNGNGNGNGRRHALTGSAAQAEFDRLEMDQYNNLSLQSQSVIENIVQIQEVTTDIDLSLEESDQTLRNLNKTTKHLRNQLTHLRMRPLSDILDRFPRALRDLGREHGKRVQLNLQGRDTLVDRNVLEALQEPLMHLLRNAFDHGLEAPEERVNQGKPEEGNVTIRAFQRGNRTIVEFQDDGRGIDVEKVRTKAQSLGLDAELLDVASQQELLSLIFEPGFSTSDKVTALSGRGVGMDVVRDRLKPVRGEISVDTQPGQGTMFTISVPFSLAVQRVLVVESQGLLLAIPADSVTEVALVHQVPELQAGGDYFEWNGESVQRVSLGQGFQFNCPRPPYSLEANPKIDSPALLMVKQGNQLVGLEIDRSWGEQEVAVRRVEGLIGMPQGFSNCTIMGDGRVIPLVNIRELLHSMAQATDAGLAPATLDAESQHQNSFEFVSQPPGEVIPFAATARPVVLVVDDSINVRRFLALTLEKAGYRVEQAKDGQQALELLSSELSVQAIICDIEMPRLDGYGVLAKVKADPAIAHLPIAMLTSRSGEKHRKLAMDLGASAYFSKPYNEQELLTQLEAMMVAA